MAYSKKKHLQDNILAIRTALRLRQELRVATAEEKEVLRRYSGFGGLKCILRPHQDPDDKSKWPSGQQELFDDTKLLYGIIGQYSASQEQYKAYCDSLQHSVLTGFYTPPPVAVAIAVALSGMGIKASRILDPSAGTGVFAEAFRQVYPCSPAVCYEKDLLTAEVLSGLYPGDLIHGAGFETIGERSLGYFDIISSNIPFGDYCVYDPVFRDSKDEDKKRCCRDIHSYFFIKAVDAAREGGLIAFITSQGVMNSPGNGYVRRWLMDRCKLVSAIRLPDDLFMDSAGTHAPSDLIVLQKDSGKTEQSSREYSFTQTRQLGGIHVNNYHMDFSRVVHTRAEAGTDQYGKPAVNFLYEGSMDELSGQLQAMLREDCRLHLDRELYDKYLEQEPVAEEIPAAVSPGAGENDTPDILPVPGKESSLYDLFGIPEEERSQIIQKQKIKAGTADNSPAVLLPGSTNSDVPVLSAHSMAPRLYEGILLDFYKDGVLVENGGQVGILSIKAVWNAKKQCEENEYLFTPLKLAPEMAGRLKAYIHLREGYFHLHFTETAQRRECPGSRNILNSRYEDFVRAYGDLNSRENYRLLMQDVFGNEILTLEYFEDGKKKLAAIFDHPVAFMTDKALLVEKADEVLAASVNKYGGVDLQYMSAISGKDAAALVEELEGSIYYNPLSKAYELPARFIAGDVIAKSEEIAAYIKANPQAGDLPASRKSLEALEKAIPEPVPFSDLCLSLGERWIPACFYNEYASRIFNTPVTVTYIADLDHFHIDAENEYTAEIRKKYAVKPGHSNILCGLTLFWHALVNTFPKVTMPSGRYNAAGKEIRIPDVEATREANAKIDEIRIPDVEATREANAKIDEIREGFGVYLDGLPIEAKGELSTLYNRMFNARVKPRYDGRFQTFPDLQLKELGIDKPYGSQYDTVWMIKLLNGAVVDVEVGGGKTLIMSIAAHELKRLKMAHKPMIIGLKSNIFAIADTYMKAYPNDKALYPTEQDFEPKNRQRLFHKIKNRDWDVIILTHEQFFKIPQSLEIQRDTLQEELDSVEENLRVYERLNKIPSSSGTLKGLQKRRENLKATLRDLFARMQARRDDATDFKEMGIDHLFVDESAEFKNLRYDTRYRYVSGLGDPQGSQRALNLLYAVRTMQQRRGSDLCATFLSGTTISNSLVELYLIFKYLRPGAMQAQGIRTFDAWAAVYAKKTSDFEFTVTNEIKQKERFRYFKNVPELAHFYMEICAYHTSKDIGLDKPENNVALHTTRPTPEQDAFQQKLIEFARSGDGKLIGRPGLMYDKKDSGRMLVVTDLARKAALDMRLIDAEKYHDHPDNKLSQAACKIADYYHAYRERRATQFVFCDIGTYKPGKDDEWNLYSELKRKLVEEHRIPCHEVRFIQEAGNIRQRAAMISDFKQGAIRVLMGHTKSLGTGIDAPDRAVATHNLDIPWTPKNLEQRGGRAARKGNKVAKLHAGNKVDTIIYASGSSLDTYKFNLLQNKQAFITQLKTNTAGKRIIDEGAMDEDGVMNYSEYVAILSGNTDLLEKVKLERKVGVLESQQKSYSRQQEHAGWTLKYNLEELAKKQERLKGIEKDLSVVETCLARDENGHRPNPLMLDGLDSHTSATATGERLLAIGDSTDTKGEYLRIGSLLGFELEVRTLATDYGSKYNRFYIRGACRYSYNNGALAQDPELAATNFIRALDKIHSLIPALRTEIAALEKDNAVLEEITSTPWKKAGELNRLRTELSALERRIQDALKDIEEGRDKQDKKEKQKEEAKVDEAAVVEC